MPTEWFDLEFIGQTSGSGSGTNRFWFRQSGCWTASLPTRQFLVFDLPTGEKKEGWQMALLFYREYFWTDQTSLRSALCLKWRKSQRLSFNERSTKVISFPVKPWWQFPVTRKSWSAFGFLASVVALFAVCCRTWVITQSLQKTSPYTLVS